MDRDLTIADTKQKILNTFKYYTQGPSVPSDGNCGLHAMCKALSDGLYMTGSNTKPKSLMLNIFYMFGLKTLPNYWWSDEELAVIANDFGYDMYIYNETDRTGIVFGKGIRPPLVLYSVNNNSHWIPGIRTEVPSSSIPENFTVIENISEVLSKRQIKIKIEGHLLMQSLNSSGGCIESIEYIESYSGMRDGSRSSSSGRSFISSSRRHNGSRSGGRHEGRGGSHGRNNVNRNKRRDGSRSGRRHEGRNESHRRNNVNRNKIRDESRSEGRDGVRIVLKQDGSRPRLEKGRGREVKGSHSGGEKGNNSGGERRSHRGREKNISRKSDEKLLLPYSPTVNDDRSYGINAVKQGLSLNTKLKNTVLSKMVKQLFHWKWNKKNKYKKLDTEDESDDSEDTELNAMYNARYTNMRDMLHNFVSKNEPKLLILEACNAFEAPQSLEPTGFQLETMKCSELEPIEVENHMDVNCCQIAAVEYCQLATVDCCSIEANVCCSNAVVDCPYPTDDCPFISTNLCNIYDCPFLAPEYPFSDQWVSDKFINNLFDGYAALERNKTKGPRFFDRVCSQAVKMSSNVIVRRIVKPKRAVETPPIVASVLVAPAVLASVVAASVVASPAMAAWMAAAKGLLSSVMQMAPEVAAPAMEMAVEDAPSGNDLVTVPVDTDILTTPVGNILTRTSAGNDSVVKPNVCVKRYFSLKQIWKKKTKTQHSIDH